MNYCAVVGKMKVIGYQSSVICLSVICLSYQLLL